MSNAPGRALQALLRITPKRSAKIVVHSVPDFEDGAVNILEGLLARGHTPLILLERPLPPDADVSELTRQGVTFVDKSTARGRLHYLTAGLVFTTHGPYRPHPPAANQKIVYLGHGEPVGKGTGYSIGDEAIGATVAIASSTVGQALRCAQHGLRPKQVLVVGAPRNDRLLENDQADMRQALGAWLPENTSTLFVWLPTFRRSVFGAHDGVHLETGMPLDFDDLQKLDRWLAENRAAILVKPHPENAAEPAGRFERIRMIEDGALRSARLSLSSILAAADCLITDVSSVWFDFLLLDRPVISCFPDQDEYRRTRSFNLEPYEAWFPGPSVTGVDGLIEEMARVAAGEDPYAARRQWLAAALHVHRDGEASSRLLDALGL